QALDVMQTSGHLILRDAQHLEGLQEGHVALRRLSGTPDERTKARLEQAQIGVKPHSGVRERLHALYREARLPGNRLHLVCVPSPGNGGGGDRPGDGRKSCGTLFRKVAHSTFRVFERLLELCIVKPQKGVKLAHLQRHVITPPSWSQVHASTSSPLGDQ